MTAPTEDDEAKARTRAALDDAVRAHAAHYVDNSSEVIVTWVALAAVRRFVDGGGYVLHIPSAEAIPVWEARGILAEALEAISYAPRDGGT